jgi:hypothetical protein
MNRSIVYAATQFGYAVQVIEDGLIIYEYTAGNCQWDSQTAVAPGSRGAMNLEQLKHLARQTATEIAEERGIPISRVEYDTDLEVQLKTPDC